MIADPLACLGFIRATNLSDHDDAVGLRIGIESRQQLDEPHAAAQVAPDADAGRLSQTHRRCPPDSLVGQCSTSADDSNGLP